MGIQHIFNLVKKNKTLENRIKDQVIPSQPYTTEYIKDLIEQKSEQTQLSSSEINNNNVLYFNALKSNKNDYISKFDDINLDMIYNKINDKALMISGDFWGIQGFIFDGLAKKRATKIIRSRSANVQIINFIVSKIVEEMFDGDTVLIGAGKFLILAKHQSNWQDKLTFIQSELDNFFVNNYFGRSGLILSATETSVEVLKNGVSSDKSQTIKQVFDNLSYENEMNKFSKFNFHNRKSDSDFLVNSFENLSNHDEMCEFCNLRIGKKHKDKNSDEVVNSCDICQSNIDLGKELVNNNQFMRVVKNSTNAIQIMTVNNINYGLEFYKTFDTLESNVKNSDIAIFNILESTKENINTSWLEKMPKLKYWSLSSRIPFTKDTDYNFYRPKTFDEILGNSSGLMALKADVDMLGDTFKDFLYDLDAPFKKFIRLSRELDFFFSDYISSLIAKDENYKEKIYVIFTGGDDVFVIGEWKEIIRFAKDLRNKFHKFSNQTTTLSVGIVMFKGGSLKDISELTDDAEKRAKSVENNSRDGIDIFNYSMKFSQFLNIESEFINIINALPKEKVTSSFLYRLMSFARMSQQSINFKNKNTNQDNEFFVEHFLWKSKLNYTYSRNIKAIDEIYNKLEKLIAENGEKTIPSIMMAIYRQRESNEKLFTSKGNINEIN